VSVAQGGAYCGAMLCMPSYPPPVPPVPWGRGARHLKHSVLDAKTFACIPASRQTPSAPTRACARWSRLTPDELRVCVPQACRIARVPKPKQTHAGHNAKAECTGVRGRQAHLAVGTRPIALADLCMRTAACTRRRARQACFTRHDTQHQPFPCPAIQSHIVLPQAVGRLG
jgi:hypothetical protein